MRPSRLLRNRLVGAVRRLSEPAARWRAEQAAPVVTLASMQRRLELLTGAMFAMPMRVAAAGSPDAMDAGAIVLPATLDGGDDARERYRLRAMQQAARVYRGSRAAAPRDLLERDLYFVLEGEAVDAELASRAPGLAPALARMRAEELARRPGTRRLVPQQRAVEALLRAVLAAPPESGAPRTPVESAALAREAAARIREVRTRVVYRPVPGVSSWDDSPAARLVDYVDLHIPSDVPLGLKTEARAEDGREGRTLDEHGTAAIDDASGDDRSARDGGAAPSGAGDADPDADGAGWDADDADDDTTATGSGGIAYPEWVERHQRLEPGRVTVRAVPAAEHAGADWALREAGEHGALLRQVRDRFALLRARRVRLRAQRAGDELDLDACVSAMIDLRRGHVPGDRLYQVTRATRHTLAIVVLVDVSGSTKTPLPDGRSVLDVERLSLLLAGEALDALGDPYAILAFSGLGRHDVRIAQVKGFGEQDRAAVHRRISSLEPMDNTRLGAAVRHATALLAAQPAARRVLLLLSDGRPNDVDRYQGSDAIEDSRQALLAARALGVHPYCLTVDAEEAEYLPHLFGPAGYRVIANPSQLPAALLHLVDRLLRG